MPDNAPNPSKGGSYTRDPVTGELTLVQSTAPAVPPGSEPEGEAQAQPDQTPQPDQPEA